jgi:MFS transporter, Spinster family, sphingosine-1-phosphate transporter
MAILAFNFVDRLALGIVLEDIKADLELTDTQLGFLTGIAFALFYAVMGIPIARWADRGNRVTIITVTTALWSAMVALCAAAGSFAQLLLIRVGVAVGEAGCLPPAQSLISDYFTRAERPRAVGIYTMGAPLSLFFGYFAAGWLNESYGWRATFVILGMPGVALAAVAWLTLREPRCRTAPSVPPAAQTSVTEVLSTLWANTTFRRLLLCISVSNFFMYGILQWLPSFFIRSYGLSTGEIGSGFALSLGLSGVLGNYWGGMLASRYAADNERLQLRVMAVLWGSSALLFACVYLVPSSYLALFFLGLGGMALTFTNGPLFAMIQTLVTPRMRAMAVAIVQLFANLIGLGLGPLAAGALSDALRPLFGDESLRYALIALCPGYLLCVWLAWRASQSVMADLAAARYDGRVAHA